MSMRHASQSGCLTVNRGDSPHRLEAFFGSIKKPYAFIIVNHSIRQYVIHQLEHFPVVRRMSHMTEKPLAKQADFMRLYDIILKNLIPQQGKLLPPRMEFFFTDGCLKACPDSLFQTLFVRLDLKSSRQDLALKSFDFFLRRRQFDNRSLDQSNEFLNVDDSYRTSFLLPPLSGGDFPRRISGKNDTEVANPCRA